MSDVAKSLPVHEPPLPVPIAVVSDYDAMIAGEVSDTVDADSLLQLATSRGRLMIHGYAGTGKTELLNRMFRSLADSGNYAVLVRLRDLSSLSARWNNLAGSQPARSSMLLAEVAQPATDESSIETIDGLFYVMVDGLDEVPSRTAEEVLAVLDDLAARVPNVVVVVTDRFALRPIDTRRWVLATLRPLDQAATGLLLGKDAEAVPQLLRVPVFADLVLQGRVPDDAELATRRTMASLIGPYLAGDIEPDFLARAAEAAFDVYASARSRVFSLDQFEAVAGKDATNALVGRGLLVVSTSGGSASFAHNLVHDYLAAYYIAQHDERWDQDGFDAVSFKAASFDVLVIAAEILADHGDSARMEQFVQQMYDWNFYAVGFVLARCVAIGSDAIPSEVFTAVEAMLAERRWDLVAATAERVTNALHLIGDATSLELLDMPDLDALQRWVAARHGGPTWFAEWRELFLTKPGTSVDADFVAAVGDRLSIRGWTAANVVKRTRPSDSGQERLRDFLSVSDPHGADSVRWRAAHALGAFPSPTNVAALFKVLSEDPYPWARYGAVRSIVEQAARTEDSDLRTQIIGRLADQADAIAGDAALILELSRSLVITRPPSGWVASLQPLLGELWNRSSGERQEMWEQVASEAASYETAGSVT